MSSITNRNGDRKPFHVAATEPPSTQSLSEQQCQPRVWLLAWTVPAVVICVWLALAWSGVLPTLIWPIGVSGACGIVAVLMLATASTTDLRSRKIRNWTTLPALAYVVGLNLIQSVSACWLDTEAGGLIGGVGISQSLLGGTLCFSGMFALHLLFGGGAGDVKIMTVIGALVGWQLAAQVWLVAMLSGATLALGYMATQIGRNGCILLLSTIGQPLSVSRFGGEWIKEHLRFQMPMAPHFTLGYTLVMGLQATGHSVDFMSYLPF